jgi:hypothetical protein
VRKSSWTSTVWNAKLAKGPSTKKRVKRGTACPAKVKPADWTGRYSPRTPEVFCGPPQAYESVKVGNEIFKIFETHSVRPNMHKAQSVFDSRGKNIVDIYSDPIFINMMTNMGIIPAKRAYFCKV